MFLRNLCSKVSVAVPSNRELATKVVYVPVARWNCTRYIKYEETCVVKKDPTREVWSCPFPCHKALGGGGVQCRAHISKLGTTWRVILLHARTAVPPGKLTSVPTEKESGCDPETSWRFWRRNKAIVPAGGTIIWQYCRWSLKIQWMGLRKLRSGSGSHIPTSVVNAEP